MSSGEGETSAVQIHFLLVTEESKANMYVHSERFLSLRHCIVLRIQCFSLVLYSVWSNTKGAVRSGVDKTSSTTTYVYSNCCVFRPRNFRWRLSAIGLAFLVLFHLSWQHHYRFIISPTSLPLAFCCWFFNFSFCPQGHISFYVENPFFRLLPKSPTFVP